jgi:hypothetical protein
MQARALVVAFVVVVLGGTAGAADRFVSPQGSDASSNDCLTSSAPCLTVGYALGQASSGDVVNVANGRYDEGPGIGASKVVTLSGSWMPDFSSRDAASRGSKLLRRLVFSAGAGMVIDVTLDGFLLTKDSGVSALSSGNGALTVRLVSTGIDFNRFSPGIIAGASDTSTLDIEATNSSVSLNRVLVSYDTGISLGAAAGAAMTLTMTDSVVERNFASAYGTSGIHATVGGTLDIALTRTRVDRNRGTGLTLERFGAGTVNLTLVDSSVSRNGKAGIVGRGADVSITNSVIARNALGIGMLGDTGPTTLEVVNSTIRGNRQRCDVDPSCTAGIVVDGPLAATVDLLNTIVWGNRAGGGTADVSINTAATVDIDHSDIGEINGAYNDLGGNISADPLCVSRRDAHLEASSPAIDAGTCVGAPPNDFDGDARPTGAGCDMGADEYVP